MDAIEIHILDPCIRIPAPFASLLFGAGQQSDVFCVDTGRGIQGSERS